MDKATKVAVEKYPHGTFDGEIGDSLRAACAVGYMQAEKDLTLTKEDVRTIFNLVRELQVKYYATEGCLQEVADIFNKQRKNRMMKDKLLERGWVEKSGIMVLFSNPRLGWKPDGTLIIGYSEWPEKVHSIEKLEEILKNAQKDS